MTSNSHAATPNGAYKGRHSAKDKFASRLNEAFFKSSVPLSDNFDAFPRFASKRSEARFLVKHDFV